MLNAVYLPLLSKMICIFLLRRIASADCAILSLNALTFLQYHLEYTISPRSAGKIISPLYFLLH